MNDKVINLVSKGLLIAFIAIGVILSSMIMSYGNPLGMKIEDTNQIGREIAEAEGMQDKLGQEDLNQFIEDTGIAKKNEMLVDQGNHVITTSYFTIGIMIFAVVLIFLGVALAIAGSPKRYFVGILSVVGFVILLIIIYSSAGTDIPASLSEAEIAKLIPEENRLFTGGNWKIAGASMVSMIVLIVAAIATIVGSEVYKLIKG